MKKYFKKSVKILLWTVGSLIALFLLLVLAIQIPAVQNFAKDKAVTYLQGKIHTKVSIDRIEIGLPKKVILEGFYFEDQKKDTLLAGKKLAVDISLFELLDNKVEINSVQLEGVTAHIQRDKNAVFNFDYIIKAFASPDKPKKDSPPMQFSMDKITLDKIKLQYNDAVSKNDILARLDHFDTRFKTFDLDKMLFDVPKLKLEGLKLDVSQGIAQPMAANTEKTAGNKPDLKLQLGKIDVSKIDVAYANENSKLSTKVILQQLLVDVDNFDLKNQSIAIKSIALSDTKGMLSIGKKIKTDSKTATNGTPNNWKIKVADVDFKKVDFRLDDDNSAAVKKGIDYKHLNLSGVNLEAKKLDYNPNTISGNINAFAAKDQSGVDIESLKTNFFYGKNGASLKNLYLKTPQTLLKDQIIASYPSIESLKDNPGELDINASLSHSHIGFKDILLFVPTLENTNPFKSNPNAILLINSRVSGKLKNLQIPNLEVSGIGTTKISASGRITGLPDVKKAYFDLDIKNLESGSKDIAQFVPKNTIPANIQLPSYLNIKGAFKGTVNNFNTNLNLKSSVGNAKIKAIFDQSRKNHERYDAQTELANFDLGKLIKNDSIGKISLRANIKGTGLNPKTASAALNGTIIKADFNKYTYQNLKLRGKINNGAFDVRADMKDPNLTFDLVSNGSFRGKYPAGKVRLNVDIADLEKLNLHAGPLKLRGAVDADVQSADLDYLNGKVSAHNLTIANAKEQFVLDSINVTAVTTADKNTIVLKSQFADAEVVGKYKLTQLATAIKNSVAKYYDASPLSKKTKTTPQQLAFKMDIKDSPVLLKLVPELKSLEPINISGRYNSVNDSIVLNGAIPKVIYGANTITNAVIKIDTKDNALVYSLMVDDIQNASIQLPYTNISGKVENNVVDYTLLLKDVKDKDRYLISGTLKAKNGNNEISLSPEKLLLNYESWAIAQDNLIRFGKDGVYANNFELSKEGNSIKIQSQSEAKNAPLAVDFKDFEIKTITSIAQKSNLEMGGTINGSALVKNISTKPLFTSDLNIDNFTFKKDTLGNINIKVDNQIADTYTARVAITGQENQVNLDGTYKAPAGNFDMNLAIGKLNLKSIQGFTMDNLADSKGYLSGDFKITGTASEPKVVGDLQFNEVGFKVTKLNSTFKSINDKISFSGNEITFDNFIIKDEKDNELSIDGKVENRNFRDFGFNLSLDADNFKAVNSKAKDNDQYYGELYLDNHLKIRGDMNQPEVEGTIKINKDTKFTIALPQSDPSVVDREGIVEFIDQDNPSLIKTVAINDSISKTSFRGINASVNIEIDKEAELSMIIDKGNGDYLKLKGEASLNGGIDPSGKTTLTGRYEFTEGTYEMTFNLIKRKFDIKKGSYILWTGEPTTADINITAVYKTEAAPIDLIGDQLGGISPESRNTYKQKIPFETELKMNGELLKPAISFDIVLPEGNNSVSSEIIDATQTKLTQLRQQPDELNKQVFALLLLNRFIGENPFASEAGSASASTLARESASKILSQQLNNLAGDLIKGVDLNFDLESSEDYTTGQKENKTDLNVEFSKKLLNDRLKVTVGSSFGLEGPQQANEETTNIAGDLSADYQLSKDGRYKVRAYRKNQYQVALQGQVIETGVAFIITIDYNKFRELFHRSKEQKIEKKNKKDVKKKSDE